MSNSIDKLTIKGFKSIASLEEFKLNKLNVLIGANGTGKSNFISFFRMLRASMKLRLEKYIQDSGGISDLLFSGPKITNRMKFEIMFGERGYRFDITPTDSESFTLENEARYYKESNDLWWQFHFAKDYKSSELVHEVEKKQFNSRFSQPVYDTIMSWQIYQFHDTSSTAGMRRYEIIEHHKNLQGDAANIAPYLYFLKEKHPAEYNDIVRATQLVIPYFVDFLLEPREFGQATKIRLSWKKKNSDYPMQPYHFSDGSIRFICLVTALFQPNPPATLIIDEPELGLHPDAIAIFAELIQATKKKMQIILATQSPTLVDHFKAGDIVLVNQKEGASVFQRAQEKELKEWLENYTLGELWRKNVMEASPNYE